LLGHAGIALGAAYLIERAVSGDGSPLWDYRLVLVAALIPDIIDKPLSLAGVVAGRAVGHSLLLLLPLALALVWLVGRGRLSPAILAVPFGMGVHLILDQIWGTPDAMLWPLLGIPGPEPFWTLEQFLGALVTEPYIYGGEILGSAVIVAVVVKHRLYVPERLRSFLRSGALAGSAQT
jgi:hypothetical protein